MAIFNVFSFPVFAGIAGIIMAIILWRLQRIPLVVRVALVILYVVAVVIFGLSRRYPAPEVTSLAEAESILMNEQPTFVMLYSNY